MENKTIDKLVIMNEKLGAPNPEPIKAIDAIEDNLKSFVTHSFQCVKNNRLFEQEVQLALSNRLPEADFNQLIRLLEVTANSNARETTNLITPFAEASITKAHDEAELVQRSSDVIHKDAPKDVLQGITAFNQLLEKVAGIANSGIALDVPLVPDPQSSAITDVDSPVVVEPPVKEDQ